MKRFALLAFALLLLGGHASAAFGLPSSGFVTTASSPFTGPSITYEPGEFAYRITVAIKNSTDGRVATFRELGGGRIMSGAPGCSGSGTSVVNCFSNTPWSLLMVVGGQGNDYIDIRGWNPVAPLGPYSTQVHPGFGNDVMQGSPGNDDFEGDFGADVAYGNAGDDSLAGQNGADTLYGGDGDDSLSSGTGPLDALWVDHLYCGNGFDTAHAPPPDVAVGCEVRR